MEEQAHRLVKVLKVLGNPLRYRICKILHEKGPISVSTLVEVLGEKQNTVSQHLSKLRKLDLVYYERDGNFLNYDIDRRDVIEPILELESNFSR
ncbi:MAG: ArsR/SmtB family transcription factor [bacterium]